MQTGLLSYRQILSVTIPVMMSLFIQFGVSVTGSAFLSRADNAGYSAVGNGGMLYITFIMIAMGISWASQIIIARRDGEGNFERAGITFRKTIVFLFLFIAIGLIFFQFASEYFIASTVKSEELGFKMKEFLELRSWGLIFIPISLSFHAFYMGLGRTTVIVMAMVVQGGVNVLLDYMWVAGGFGCKQLGVEGAAMAMVISDAAAAAVYILYAMVDKQSKKYALWKNEMNDPESAGLIKLSWPLMVQGLLATGSWTVFFFMIEHLGKKEVEISQNIRNIYFLCLISIIGFGSATRTFISQMIAKKEQDLVIPNLKRIIKLCFLITSAVVLTFVLIPETVIGIVNENPHVMEESVFTLRVISFSILWFTVCGPMLNMISGAGDTRINFLIEFTTILVYLAGSYLVTIVFPQPIHIVWCVEYLYFGVMFLLCWWYIRSGKWRHIKI